MPGATMSKIEGPSPSGFSLITEYTTTNYDKCYKETTHQETVFVLRCEE